MIIIKAGGSAITDKKLPFSIKAHALENMARALADVKEDVILCHGGGSFGHPLAIKYNIKGNITTQEQKIGISHINLAMRNLSNIVCETLIEAGCRPFALQSSACMTTANGVLETFNGDLVKKTCEKGFIPLLYGDVVHDSKNGFSIISGDQIMKHLAITFPNSRMIFLTDVDGIYTADPKRNENAALIKEMPFSKLSSINAGGTGDATGGMKGKLGEIIKLEGLVNEILIINIEKEDALPYALKGENPGTRIY